MKKIKEYSLVILGVIVVVLLWIVYSLDRMITCVSLQPKPGFSRWLHTPQMKTILPPWMGGQTVEHNLQLLAFIRVTIFLTFVLLLW